MPKAQRKKFSPQKQMQRLTTAALRSTALGFVVGSDDKMVFINLKTNQRTNPTLPIIKALTNVKYKWSVLCAVSLRAQDGGEYLQCIEIESKAPEYQNDMTATLSEHHNQLIKECNQAHICTVAWLAVPYTSEWDIKNTTTTLNALGAWDFTAKWEQSA